MSYTISKGIPEAKLSEWLKTAAAKFGVFEDGRVDYTEADEAPIVMCTVVCGDEILLVKRGHGLADANGYWSTINGFIDEVKPVRRQAQQEIGEELGLAVNEAGIKVGRSYTLQNPKEKRRYIVFPCRVNLAVKPAIVLNEEHTDWAWVRREQLADYDMLDDLPYSIDAALAA